MHIVATGLTEGTLYDIYVLGTQHHRHRPTRPPRPTADLSRPRASPETSISLYRLGGSG